eukprot:CAMPEP_0184326300 /NCGR_PEP_ID=MMETSP1049-20130417/142491_1 /TAXON_ID=77928 /ORGANISM="Proteomonas sulcata, Strain CCMP704" /LENGTH=227 /DNA_ID=CAMNT_0026648487 /DNA_START=312 /DNA_END=997 /DNA_ORIENTATION=+
MLHNTELSISGNNPSNVATTEIHESCPTLSLMCQIEILATRNIAQTMPPSTASLVLSAAMRRTPRREIPTRSCALNPDGCGERGHRDDETVGDHINRTDLGHLVSVAPKGDRDWYRQIQNPKPEEKEHLFFVEDDHMVDDVEEYEAYCWHHKVLPENPHRLNPAAQLKRLLNPFSRKGGVEVSEVPVEEPRVQDGPQTRHLLKRDSGEVVGPFVTAAPGARLNNPVF